MAILLFQLGMALTMYGLTTRVPVIKNSAVLSTACVFVFILVWLWVPTAFWFPFIVPCRCGTAIYVAHRRGGK